MPYWLVLSLVTFLYLAVHTNEKPPVLGFGTFANISCGLIMVFFYGIAILLKTGGSSLYLVHNSVYPVHGVIVIYGRRLPTTSW